MSFNDLNLFVGSRPSDISGLQSVANALPPCPDSPNCIRVTRKINYSSASVFSAAFSVAKGMGAIEMEINHQHQKIDAVFKVLLFKDDMTIQVEPGKSDHSYIHIRSASRTGENDVGVNTRRVKRFLQKLNKHLGKL